VCSSLEELDCECVEVTMTGGKFCIM
jgi:hypothetical protein